MQPRTTRSCIIPGAHNLKLCGYPEALRIDEPKEWPTKILSYYGDLQPAGQQLRGSNVNRSNLV